MVQINQVPQAVLSALAGREIPEERLLLAVRSDMNRDGVWCDNWLFATSDELILLCGILQVRADGPNLFGRRKKHARFEELSFDRYPLASLEDFRVEELISSCRITAKDSEGRFVLLTLMSNAAKEDMHTFLRYLKQIKEKGEVTIDPNEEKVEKFCPKCGARYADPERKICPRCMDRGKILRRIWQFFLKYRVYVFIVLALMLVSSVLSVLAPYISSGFYYDQVLEKTGQFYGNLLLILFLIFGTRLLTTLISIVSGLISSRISAKVVYDLKCVIFSSIERLSISFFTGRQTGGLMTQVNSDAGTIYWFFCDMLPWMVVGIVQTVVVFVVMLRMNWMLTLLSMVVLPLMFFAFKRLFDHMTKLDAKRYGRSRVLNSTLSDVLSGVRVVKAFSKEREEGKRFGKQSENLAEADMNASTFESIAFPSVGILLYISQMMIWAIGGWMVIEGSMSYGTLITFIAYVGMTQNSVFTLLDMMDTFPSAMNAMSRLIEVMDAVPDVVESPHPVPLDHPAGRVEFSHVGFSYVKNRKVIDDVSFTVEAGEKLGIVGHTGAGKSTLANLLIRLYDVSDGEITIDGINVRDISFAQLRDAVSIVSQETYLFAGTILDNIRYARPDATRSEIIEAAKIAGAHTFIIKLPDAYETMIGFGYKDLSGGERQRISIARAILRNPKILIMDEATAAMDTETERQIQTALERLTKGRTTIMIAHRLSTLRDADKLIVIENGKVPEAGTHHELINKKGIYFNLYKLQMEALRNIGIEG